MFIPKKNVSNRSVESCLIGFNGVEVVGVFVVVLVGKDEK